MLIRRHIDPIIIKLLKNDVNLINVTSHYFDFSVLLESSPAFQDFLYLIIDQLVDIVVCALQKIRNKKSNSLTNVTFL